MAEFTAGVAQEANEEPVLRYGRLVYRGRILSAPEWFPFWDRYAAIGDKYRALAGAENPPASVIVALAKESHVLHVDYLRAVFPARRFVFWAPSVVEKLARGHPKELRETFERFFSLQARAMGLITPEKPSPSTAGTSSNDSTAEASA